MNDWIEQDWLVLLSATTLIIFIIAVVLSICKIFRTCNQKSVSNEHTKLIIVLASLVMASPVIFPVIFLVCSIVFYSCAYCLCEDPQPVRLATLYLARIVGKISIPAFLIVHSVVGTRLAAKLHYIFKNPWAALIAYIFPPVAIIAAAKSTKTPIKCPD